MAYVMPGWVAMEAYMRDLTALRYVMPPIQCLSFSVASDKFFDSTQLMSMGVLTLNPSPILNQATMASMYGICERVMV